MADASNLATERGIATSRSARLIAAANPIVAVALIGAAIRLVHYLGDRSLWLDEAMLALNIRERSFAALLQPLGQDQMAPPGYLFLVKAAIGLFGDSEYALRLPALAAGLFGLWLFVRLVVASLPRRAQLTAVALFALSPFTIYFTAEVKQYEFDATATILLLWLAWRYLQREGRAELAALAVSGALISWFSHPSVFVLAAIGGLLALSATWRREWRLLAALIGICALWLISFAVNLSATGALGGPVAAHMQGIYWRGAFLPMPPRSFADVVWPVKAILAAFVDPGGFKLSGLAALLALAGAIAAWRRDRLWMGMLVLPAAIALIASGLKLYPFAGRFLLFAVPSLVILMSLGLTIIVDALGKRDRIVATGLVLLLLLSPLLSLARDLSVRPPFARMEIKQAMDHVAHNMTQGDTLYIYFGAEYAFRYYAPRYDFRDARIIFGKAPRLTVKDPNGNWDQYIDDVDRLKGQGRVWIIMAGQKAGEEVSGMDQERFFLYFADKIGRRLGSFEGSAESAAYLYDFGSAASADTGRDQ